MPLKCLLDAPNSDKSMRRDKRKLEVVCADEHKDRIAKLDVVATYIPYGARTDKPSVQVDVRIIREANVEKNVTEQSEITLTPSNCVLLNVDVPRADKGYFIDTVIYQHQNGTTYKFPYGTH